MCIEELVLKYSNTLYKICIVMLCNEQDAKDAVQDTFCRYLEKRPDFTNEEHGKAWLIRVASNICRDMLRARSRHPKVSIDDLSNVLAAPAQRDVLTELMELPPKQKAVIYLHYVDGYSVKEIADILKITESAVKKRMQRGREYLRLSWKEEEGRWKTCN